ncbi:MAG: hypothetical protein AB1717_00785 [Pseudomonadota bacterium]
MGGATFVCGSFEGNDKSASPITSVLEEAFAQAYGRKPRGRLRRRFAELLGRASTGEMALAEEAIIFVRYSEESAIPPAIAERFLPFFENYQARLLKELNIPDDLDEIWPFMTPTTKAKYGFVRDPGWHLYCLHDLIPACRKSMDEQIPIQIFW